jgi:multiple sugar transport system permease protein
MAAERRLMAMIPWAEKVAAGQARGPAPPRPARPPFLERAHRALRLEQARYGYFFLLPVLLHFAVFVAFPVAFSFYLSFHEWNILSEVKRPIGLENYATLLRSESFVRSVINTGVFTVSVVGITVVLSLGLASALDRPIRGVALFRGIFYSPVVTSAVATGLVWLWILDPHYGIVNQLLAMAHLPQPAWASSPAWAMPAVVLTFSWREVGFFTVIYLAALQGIPMQYREAAQIDGAGPWQVFRRITLPLLMPTTLFVLVMGTVRATQLSFGLIYVMTGGGPVDATNVIVLYLYQQAFDFFKMGYASAVAYVLFAFTFVLTLIQFKVLGRRTEF